MKHIYLDRSLIKISGIENKVFLQKLITNDVFKIKPFELVPSCLLTPQGKILFSFLVSLVDNDIYLDINTDKVEVLANRLTIYKLNADVDIKIYKSIKTLIATNKLSFIDKRFPKPLYRTYQNFEKLPELNNETLNLNEYYIDNGISYNIESNKYFPHDLNYDLINAVSFTKGCFIGQEVVARMQHKATLKKRCLIINSSQPMHKGDIIYAGTKIAGIIHNSENNKALAVLRLNYIKECENNFIQIKAPFYLNLT